MKTKAKIIEILHVNYISGFKLQFIFNDQKEQIIDFEPFLRKSRNPMVKKYLNLDEFKKYKIEYGDIIWNDYELCFPIADLYDDNI